MHTVRVKTKVYSVLCVCEGMFIVHMKPKVLYILVFMCPLGHDYSVHEAHCTLWAFLGVSSSSEMQWDMTWDVVSCKGSRDCWLAWSH